MKNNVYILAAAFVLGSLTSNARAEFEQSTYLELGGGYAWRDPIFNFYSPLQIPESAVAGLALRWMATLNTGPFSAELHLHNSLTGNRQFGDAGSMPVTGFRSALLQRHWAAFEKVRGVTELDYLNFSLEAGPLRLKAGRQAINLAQNLYFPVTDYFSPFAASDFVRLYKAGVDALRLTLALGQLSEFEVIAVAGYEAIDPSTNPKRHNLVTRGPEGLSGLIGRLVRTINHIEVGILGGHLPLSNIAAAWLTREIGKASVITVESTWAVPEGSFAASGHGWDASLGLSTQWSPRLNTRLEVLAANRRPYSPSGLDLASETTAFAFGINRELTPLTQAAFLLMFDPDHTALFINLGHSLSNESEISADIAWPLAGRTVAELGAFPLQSERADYLRGPLAYSPARISASYRHFF